MPTWPKQSWCAFQEPFLGEKLKTHIQLANIPTLIHRNTSPKNLIKNYQHSGVITLFHKGSFPLFSHLPFTRKSKKQHGEKQNISRNDTGEEKNLWKGKSLERGGGGRSISGHAARLSVWFGWSFKGSSTDELITSDRLCFSGSSTNWSNFESWLMENAVQGPDFYLQDSVHCK